MWVSLFFFPKDKFDHITLISLTHTPKPCTPIDHLLSNLAKPYSDWLEPSMKSSEPGKSHSVVLELSSWDMDCDCLSYLLCIGRSSNTTLLCLLLSRLWKGSSLTIVGQAEEDWRHTFWVHKKGRCAKTQELLLYGRWIGNLKEDRGLTVITTGFYFSSRGDWQYN